MNFRLSTEGRRRPESWRGAGFGPAGSRAFTRTELLVVIAVVAVLVAWLFAGVGDIRGRTRANICQGNARQLMTAWSQYANDNHFKCVNNFGPATIIEEIKSGRLENWANSVMSWGASDTAKDLGNTNLDWINHGILGRYIGGNVSVYKCPSDTFLSEPQVKAGWKARLRSVSMNGFVGPFSREAGAQKAAVNRMERAYRQFLKVTDIPEPSGLFVTLDENPNSINDALFYCTMNNAAGWSDSPASYHQRGAGVAFADGHAEIHRWVGGWVDDPLVARIPSRAYWEDRTMPGYRIKFGDDLGPKDFDWLWARTSQPIRPPQQ